MTIVQYLGLSSGAGIPITPMLGHVTARDVVVRVRASFANRRRQYLKRAPILSMEESEPNNVSVGYGLPCGSHADHDVRLSQIK
jgi:hypothetical protein